MKHFCIFLLLLISISSFAQKTESPYLEILTPNAVIPLKSTKANVKISGNIAHVHIAQTYQNTGKTPIEAKYLFPLSTQAAVHKMQMTIGNRTINAQIFEKQEAQRVYDKALKEGKRAAKLDQQRPNVFQMNVGNILKNDLVTIDIYYTEILVPLAGSYEFVFPGVVGPRYTGEQTSGETTFSQPYTKKGVADTYQPARLEAILGLAELKDENSANYILKELETLNTQSALLLDAIAILGDTDFIPHLESQIEKHKNSDTRLSKLIQQTIEYLKK